MKIYHLLAYRNDTGELISQNEALISNWVEYKSYCNKKFPEYILWSVSEYTLFDSIKIAEGFCHVTYQAILIYSSEQLTLEL
jgi:hypothetical protein